MQKLVYEGPSDEFEAKNIVGHSLKFYPVDGAAEVRPRNVKAGEPREVEEQFVEELLTMPGHRFRVVEDAPPADAPVATVETPPTVGGSPEPVPVVDAETGESVRSRSKKGGS